jgi:hypothetical protein
MYMCLLAYLPNHRYLFTFLLTYLLVFVFVYLCIFNILFNDILHFQQIMYKEGKYVTEDNII